MSKPSSIARPRSPLWMVILALVCEEPMHPYRMQMLIRQRGKDLIANVAQRNSVYQTIGALLRSRLIVIRETSRPDSRPERTVYEATKEGRRALRSWVRTALSTPAREFPEFPAALATLDPALVSTELALLLETRLQTLEPRRATLAQPYPDIPRLFLLESEYMETVLRAEITWLGGVIDDLRRGRLAFPSVVELQRLSSMGGPSAAAIEVIVAEKQKSRDAHTGQRVKDGQVPKPTATKAKAAKPKRT